MPALATGNTSGTFGETQDQVVKTGPYIQNTPTPVSYTTAGPQTYTAADILGTIIVRNGGAANRVDVLPTAALMVAAMSQDIKARVGDTVWCLIINGTSSANTIQITAGAGGALDPNQAAGSALISQNSSKEIAIRLTNVTPGAEAYIVYS